jgi:methylmalonyl-CoA/ethylmalonyl-CoA epimerase
MRNSGGKNMLEKLDHIGVAVESIEEYIPLYRDVLGMKFVKTEEIADQKVRVAFFEVGATHIELIEPTSEDAAIAAHLKKRGPGMHHLAYRVQDIEAALGKLKEQGLRLIDAEPRIGAGGKRIAFIHPKSTGGILTELVENP